MLAQDVRDGGGDGAAVGVGVGASPLHVVDVRLPRGRVGVKGEYPTGHLRRAGEVVAADGLADRARAGVDHEPELVALRVGLELDQVISAAQRAEL